MIDSCKRCEDLAGVFRGPAHCEGCLILQLTAERDEAIETARVLYRRTGMGPDDPVRKKIEAAYPWLSDVL